MNQPLPKAQMSATYQDVLDAPPNTVAELVAGKLHLQPRPAARHGLAGSRLGMKIGGPFDFGDDDGPGGWWTIDKPEIHLGENVLVPGMAGWRRERVSKYPDTTAFELIPSWVCGILSPSTRRFDLTEKRALYGEARVPHLWFVDPNACTLEAFENRNESWVLITALKNDDTVCLPPFEAIEFPLSVLWPD